MLFHGVLGEDISDAEAVACLVHRLREKQGLRRVKIKCHGYDGCNQLLRKGHAQLKAWERAGCKRAIVCYDADTEDPAIREKRIKDKIIGPSGVEIGCLALVPVRELEAWIHADIGKLEELFNWCRNLRQVSNPESIIEPKEELIKLSKHPVTKNRHYSPPQHNEFMAKIIDLDLVKERCNSFRKLVEFVEDE
jgi:hypothetical protein